jgi:hypothetical protein
VYNRLQTEVRPPTTDVSSRRAEVAESEMEVVFLSKGGGEGESETEVVFSSKGDGVKHSGDVTLSSEFGTSPPCAVMVMIS